MKNIHDILSGFGITVPEDKKKDFETAFNENYKTVAEVGKITAARDNYKSQLETAQTALKEFEGVDVAELKGKVKQLNIDLENEKIKYQSEITKRDQSDWLKAKFDEYGVKSPYARRQLASDCMSENSGLKWNEGAFFGFDDFMKAAKEKDNSLYLTSEEKKLAEKERNAPKFTGPLTPTQQTEKYIPPKIF